MAFKAGIFEDSLIKFNLDLWTIFWWFYPYVHYINLYPPVKNVMI